MKIIGIAGGSGSGKSTVSYTLLDSDPDRFEIINLDDYHRHRDEPDLPMFQDMINWDHPDIMRWNDLIDDIEQLKSGKAVTVSSKAQRWNPHYAAHRRVVSRTVQPKPILIVEGYLALYNPKLRQLYDMSFYLDLDKASRLGRRDKQKLIGHEKYNEKVLIPMHEKYIEPTRDYADVIIDVAGLNAAEATTEILGSIRSL